jgi:hypothetical protein
MTAVTGHTATLPIEPTTAEPLSLLRIFVMRPAAIIMQGLLVLAVHHRRRHERILFVVGMPARAVA